MVWFIRYHKLFKSPYRYLCAEETLEYIDFRRVYDDTTRCPAGNLQAH